MKKKFLAILLVFACVASLFVGCQEDTPKVDYLHLSDNKTTEYQIVSYLTNKKPVTTLSTDLVIMSGAKFEIVKPTAAGEKAIYIGTAAQLEGMGGVSTELIYTTYEIKVDNGNVYVAMANEDMAESVIALLKKSIVKIADGCIGIDKNISGIKNIADISADVPEFITQSGKMRDPYDAGNGNYQITYQQLKVTESDQEVLAYEQSLVDAGYTLHQYNEVNGNSFFTYVNGDTMVHCNYFKTLREFRIVYGPKTYMGSTEPITDYEKKVTPSISIIGMTDNVLCMVYQAPDGSFVIIDGGWNDDKLMTKTMNAGTSEEKSITYKRDVKTDMANLWALLESKTPEGQKPQVTWMITHADPDHICLPPVFMTNYKDKFDLNLVVYNFPNLNEIGLENGNPKTFQTYIDTFINAAKNHFPNAQHMVYHTGQKLYLPGTEIEFLFTPEDYWPHSMPWMNHTSGAWQIKVEGKTIMITGDCETGLNDQMVRVFGTHLQSDILQLNHHGANGATLNFYKVVKPTVAFWPCQQYHFDYDRRHLGIQSGYDFNKYIRETCVAHYTNTETHTVLLPSLQEEK